MATLTACVALGLLAFPAVSPAPVPPQDCGFMTVKNKRLNVKADRLRCEQARKYVRRFYKGEGGPKGYTCQSGSELGSTSIDVRCFKGSKEFFAIRR